MDELRGGAGNASCASTGGALVSVDVDTRDGEEVGSVDSGLRAVAWSSNQEMLALVTGAGSLLVMSNDWEVLHETELERSLPSELELGTPDKTKRSSLSSTHWENWRTDVRSQSLARRWIGAGLASIASCEVRKGRLVVVFFERNGLRHGEFVIPATHRAPQYRVGSVRWNTTSDTIAVSLHPTGIEDDNNQRSVIQLWSRNNYHWYLKQELQLRTGDRLVDFAWDEEAAGRLNVVACSSHAQALTFYEHEFVWDICSVEAEQLALSSTPGEDQEVASQRQSVAVTGVIDGSKLLVTPLHLAMVPPPFALLQATFEAAISSVVFDSQTEALLVLLANGDVILVENYLTPADTRAAAAGLPPPPNAAARSGRSDTLMSMTTVKLPVDDEACTLSSLLWVHFNIESHRLVFAVYTLDALSDYVLVPTQVTRRESQLRIAPLSGIQRHSCGQASGSNAVKFESRSIERGALLVATVGQRASVIVQMPRGNLECMSPRLLVLALVVQQIQAQERGQFVLEALGLYDLDLVRSVATHSQRDPKEYVPFLDRVARLENENWRKYTIDFHLERHARALTHVATLINETSADDQAEKSKLHGIALDLVTQGELYDEALEVFPAKRFVSQSDREFRKQILRLKGEFLDAGKKYEAAAYVYLAASEKEKARGSFIAAHKWQMALALSARDQTPNKLRNEAYALAQELLNKQQQQQDGAVDDILAVSRIYVEYCNDIDEAVALLVTHQQWAEALRIAYLHQRDDLVESDVEPGVLQCCDDVQEELERKEKHYVKHWKRLTTIREQKRLFKLHGIDGSRWDHGNGGDGDTDAGSIRSGASSAADSALSFASVSSVGSHNSAASIGNFSIQSLSMATASHFYATQALGSAGKKPKTKAKHGGIPSRRERRKRMKEGSAEEEAYVEQQLSELRPNAALAREVGCVLEMLVFLGHVQQAQKLQTQLAGFEKCVADKKMPISPRSAADKAATCNEGQDYEAYPEWRLEALQD
ncbi:IKI3 protein [Phytophthora cactorum]|nr:IKI3 protein [Phytophthora cactorum]